MAGFPSKVKMSLRLLVMNLTQFNMAFLPGEVDMTRLGLFSKRGRREVRVNVRSVIVTANPGFLSEK